ncbi:MAG: hypothetical protein IH598_00690 [Bacteroidales bacterium]|nr:hypothetical protein [Bacteroidales bacterium]
MKKLLMFIFLGFLFMAMAGNNLMAQSLQKQPDGVNYEVVGTRYEWRVLSVCGYNDVSDPNHRKFDFVAFYDDFRLGYMDGYFIGNQIDCSIDPYKYCDKLSLTNLSSQYLSGYLEGIKQGQKDKCEQKINNEILDGSFTDSYLKGGMSMKFI